MNETIKELIPYLQDIATKLNVTVDHVWVVLVQEMKIEAISYFIGYILVLASFASMWAFRNYMLQEVKSTKFGYDEPVPRYKEHETTFGMGVMLSAIVGSVGSIYVCETFSTFLSMVFNPEYQALVHLLKMVKQ